MESKIIEFDGGGSLKLELTEKGIGLIFQAIHSDAQFKITSMNVVLMPEEGKEMVEWLHQAIDFQEGKNE